MISRNVVTGASSTAGAARLQPHKTIRTPVKEVIKARRIKNPRMRMNSTFAANAGDLYHKPGRRTADRFGPATDLRVKPVLHAPQDHSRNCPISEHSDGVVQLRQGKLRRRGKEVSECFGRFS